MTTDRPSLPGDATPSTHSDEAVPGETVRDDTARTEVVQTETGSTGPSVERPVDPGPCVSVVSRHVPSWDVEIPITVVRTPHSVATRVAVLVPGMRAGAPKRNLLVGLLYTVASMTLTTIVQSLL